MRGKAARCDFKSSAKQYFSLPPKKANLLSDSLSMASVAMLMEEPNNGADHLPVEQWKWTIILFIKLTIVKEMEMQMYALHTISLSLPFSRSLFSLSLSFIHSYFNPTAPAPPSKNDHFDIQCKWNIAW
jgi:hypothetical protein